MQSDAIKTPGAPALPYTQALGGVLRMVNTQPLLQALEPAIAHYILAPPKPAQAIFSLARNTQDLLEIERIASAWQAHNHTLVVVGAGGSGLSGKALGMLGCGLHLTTGPRALHVLDNLDAFTFTPLLERLDLAHTCFLVISKSGSTVETYAQTLTLIAALLEQGITDVGARMTVITIPDENPLHALALRYGIPVLAHDLHLGGRFSILSSVGLIPAAFMGLDVRAIRAGSKAALDANLHIGSEAALGAALQVAMLQEGRNISIFMPYSEQLFGLAQWWRQSWAESLGKDGRGTTPVMAMGTADQHSQLQLFLGGPDDKCFTLLLTDCAGKGRSMPQLKGPLAYLSQHTLGDLVAAQQLATAETLERHGRPLRVFHIPEVNAFTYGALIMHFTLEIIYTAALLEMNPFDQPAVEESKRLAHAYLTRGL